MMEMYTKIVTDENGKLRGVLIFDSEKAFIEWKYANVKASRLSTELDFVNMND